MEPVEKGYEIYTQFGFAGLFVFLFLVLFFMSIYEARRNKKEIMDIQQKTITALERATQATNDSIDILETVKETLDQNTRQSAEALAYIRARDQFFGNGGGRKT